MNSLKAISHFEPELGPANEWIHTSKNSGETWSRQRIDNSWAPVYSISFVDTINGWYIKNRDIFRTKNGGSNWENMKKGFFDGQLYDVQFLSPDTGYTFGPHHFLKTNDSGLNWEIVYNDNDIILTDFSVVNSKKYFLIGFGSLGWVSYLKYTNDGGLNWNIIQYDSITFSKIKFFSDTYGYASAHDIKKNDYKILRTNDGGYSWTNEHKMYEALTSFSFSDSLNGSAITDQGIIVRRNPINRTWDLVYQGLPKLNSIFMLSSSSGFAVGESGVFLRTFDGVSWQELPRPTNIGLSQVFFTNDQIGWIYGPSNLTNDTDSGYLFKTVDSGMNWNIVYLFYSMGKFTFIDESVGFGTIVSGGIIKTSTGGGIINQFTPNINLTFDSQESRLQNNYPNPFNSATTIKYKISKAGHVIISIFDINGKLIKNLVDRYFISGNYSVTWTTQGLSSGIYFCSITHNGKIKDSKRLLLIK